MAWSNSSNRHLVPGLVSVVMPVLNGSACIAEAINSVLAQSYSHWELLITDDGSSDRTLDVVHAFEDSRIHVFRQSRQGVSAARNCSLELASGEFITFLDADDALPPKSLEARIRKLQDDPSVDVVDGVFIVCGADLNMKLRLRNPGSRGPLLPSLLSLDERVFRGVCYLFRRRLLGSVRFQPSMNHSEDLLFFIELAATSNPVYTSVNDATYLYRTGTSSAMTNLDGWEQGYFQLLQQLHRIPQLSWRHRLTAHLHIARILLGTWLRRKQLIRALLSASRALMLALPQA